MKGPTGPSYPNEYEAKLEAEIQTASDIFRSIALLVGHPLPDGDNTINLRELYDKVAGGVQELKDRVAMLELPDQAKKESWQEGHDDALKDVSEERREYQEENDTLRVLLAKGKGPCVYCQLPAEDIAKCQFGFPGCGRMDDLAIEINSAVESRLEKLYLDLMEERDTLRAALALAIPARAVPSVDQIILNRKMPHKWQPVPPEIETDRTDEPCLLCINSKDDPIHV